MESPDEGAVVVKPVIGLEIHVQLATRSRLFSSCPRAGDTSAIPNSSTDPVTLGLPGTLPALNRAAITRAIRLGLAFGCEVASRSEFDRKHYFYPDLPRNFQITQERLPLLRGGAIDTGSGIRLPLIRCHVEEDAGRSVHLDGCTRVDFNRAGVGLLEIVTEPALRDPEDAAAVLISVRELARWLSINEGSLEEGQLRCDANVSLMQEDGRPGARVELKNLNSIRGVARAIATEIERQRLILADGGAVTPQTRGWDARRGESFAQRGKEDTVDYRFLPEPDLGPLVVDDEWVAEVRAGMPELPSAIRARWGTAGMAPEATQVLSATPSRAAWVDQLLAAGAPADEVGRWGGGEFVRRAREEGVDLPGLAWPVGAVAELLTEVSRGVRSHTEARELLDTDDLAGVLAARPPGPSVPVDEAILSRLLACHPDQVAHYRSGKTGLLGWFVAEARRSLPGSVDPALLAKSLRRLLSGDD